MADPHPARKQIANRDGVQQPSDAPRRIPAVDARRAALIAFVAGLVVLAFIASIGSVPSACAVCHRKQVAAMNASAHKDVTCYDCHVANGMWGVADQKNAELMEMYPAALFGVVLTDPARQTARSACLGCHEDVNDHVSSGVGGIRIKHATCAKGPTCDACHSETAHGKTVRWQATPRMEMCVKCHEDQAKSVKCDTCHVQSDDRRDIRGPWQVTHGPDWKKTHGLGNVKTCSTCHAADYCAKCHKTPIPHQPDFGAAHGDAAKADTKACLVCHKSEKAFCDAVCHTLPMPHPAGFKKDHPKIARTDKDERCFRCHVEDDCSNCHTNHIHPGGSQGVPVPWTETSETLRP